MIFSKEIKRLLINIAVLLFSLCFLFLIFEALLRAFPHTSLLRIGHHKLFCEYDALLGWRKIPNAKGVHRTSEYSVIERMNSKGIRGPEYSYNKAEGEYRVLILGDSFAEGYTVEFHNLFSEVLKRKLNSERDAYCEVVNAGTGGYSTDQEILFFQNEGEKYRPDLVILAFCDNDVWYNNKSESGRGYYKPLFKMVEGKLQLRNVPVTKIEIKKKFIERIKEWFREKSYIYNFLVAKVKNNHYLYPLAIKLGLAQDVNVLITDSKKSSGQIVPVPSEFRVHSKRHDNVLDEAWTITEALLVEFRKEAESVGGQLLVFYAPSRAAIYLEEWDAMKEKYGLSDTDWDINHVGLELENICKRNNIDFTNPVQLFKLKANRLSKEGKRLYFFLDGHWNDYGHELAGEILAKHIHSYYLQ